MASGAVEVEGRNVLERMIDDRLVEYPHALQSLFEGV